MQRAKALDSLDPGEREFREQLRQNAIGEGASEETKWLYFRSPEWTWQQECGREGWLLYDPASKKQYAFLMTAMN